MPRDEKIELLRQCFIFSRMDARSCDLVLRDAVVERFETGESVFAAGDESDGMRIVMRGLFRVWIAGDGGRERTLRLIERGSVFGEVAMLDGLGRTANVDAFEAGECLTIHRGAFMRLIEENPALMRPVMEILCERLRYSIDDIGDLTFFSLRQRLGRKICELAFSHARVTGNRAVFTRRFSQMELAQHIGATREAVNRQVSAMVRDGLISIKDGIMEIEDLVCLTRL